MLLEQIVHELNLEILSGDIGAPQQIQDAYVSDLLSDVLANAKPDQIWLTVQTHENVLALAIMKNMAAIVLVNGVEPDEALILKNAKECFPVLGTRLASFECAGKLYNLLKSPML